MRAELQRSKIKETWRALENSGQWDFTGLHTLQNGSELLPQAKHYLYSKTRHLFNTWQEIQEYIQKNMANHQAMKCHGASNFILWHFRDSTPSISIPPSTPKKENRFGFKLIVAFKTLTILLRCEYQHFPSPSACPDKTCTWLKWTIHWWSALKQSWISTGPRCHRPAQSWELPTQADTCHHVPNTVETHIVLASS